jgi:hypothetical protein
MPTRNGNYLNMFNRKGRKRARSRLNIVVGCWNDSIEKHLRRVVINGMMQGFDVDVKICTAKPVDRLWLDRQ